MKLASPAVAIGALAMVIGVGACSAPTGPPSVDKTEVARQISTQLKAKAGKAPDIVACPKDLEAKVDATLICTLTDQGKVFNVTATVTSVQDGKAEFGIQVASQPNPAP